MSTVTPVPADATAAHVQATAAHVQATAENTIGWLQAPETTIVVPVYQRQYRWDIGGCEQLLSDVRAVSAADATDTHFIGSILSTAAGPDDADTGAHLVLIDGQQRVTALMAALLGTEVLTEDYETVQIRIAFNPQDEKFEVANPAIRKNPAWLPDVAAVFAMPFRHEVFSDQSLPDPVYAHAARRLCDETGALLVVDDVRAGFRLARDCSWAPLGVAPDLSCWGKAFANGHPISAVLGSEAIRQAATEIFVTGSFWFAALPMAAAVATLARIRDSDYLERLTGAGQRLRDGLDARAADHGFALRQTGPAQMPQILFEDDPDHRLGYAWAAEALRHGAYFHPYHNMFLSAAHTDADIDQALGAADRSFAWLRGQRGRLPEVAQLAPLLKARAQAAAH